MNGFHTFVLWIIAIAIIALIGLIISVLQQIKKLISHIEQLAERLDRELPPLVGNLNDASQSISRLARNADERLTEAADLFKAVRDLTAVASAASAILKGGADSAGAYIKSTVAGIKAAVDFLGNHTRKRG